MCLSSPLRIAALLIVDSQRRLPLPSNTSWILSIPRLSFHWAFWGVWIGRELRIPVIHTYHTQYEDYVRYIARGMVIRPSMVKYIVRSYMNDLDGVICPSEIVYDLPKSTRSRQKTHYSDEGLIWPSLTDQKLLRQRQQPFVKNMKSQKMKRFIESVAGFL